MTVVDFKPKGKEAVRQARDQYVEELCTDEANACRLYDRIGPDTPTPFFFLAPSGPWYAWGGKRWEKDEQGLVTAATDGVTDDVLTEAQHYKNSELNTMLRHVKDTGSLRGKRAMIELVKSKIGMTRTREELDRHPHLLGVNNGVVDLRTGKLREGRPGDLITRSSPVNFDPDAECPTFLRALREWLENKGNPLNDPYEMVAFLRRAIGYTLSGETSEQCLFVLEGRGANGKTKLGEVLMGMLGGDLTWPAPGGLLLVNRNQRPFELGPMADKRFATVSETADGLRLDEAKVKRWTGGDSLTAEFKYRDAFQFTMTAKLWMDTNYRPTIRGNDDGIWRRIVLIKFPNQFFGARRDQVLAEKLRGELPGILAWAVRGAVEWYAVRDDRKEGSGLGVPESVKRDSYWYRSEQDIVGRFFDECVHVQTEAERAEGQATIKVSVLYDGFANWCKLAGEESMSMREFNRDAHERLGHTKEKKRTGTYWNGLRLA